MAIAFAAVVGGVTTAVVMAAIPGNDGLVHACYNKTSGALKVIDTDTGKICTNQQNAISWPANTGELTARATFNDDGSLNTAGSKNIVTVQFVPDGSAPGSGLMITCFELSFTPKFGYGEQAFGGPLQGALAGGAKPFVQTEINTACGSSNFNAA
ncbi:MAG TPA: hypothetical protein VGO07_06295, partial [Candidatus Saccharimonadales bacterium]|nr:hypothetical protein [Candidatus Saccharimonadales bacterium]